MQATLLLISAIAIGLGLSVWEMHNALQNQRAAMLAHAGNLLDLTLGGATSAAWALDEKLAQEVVATIVNQGGVVAVQIQADLQGESQRLLARAENSQQETDALTRWVAQRFFADVGYAGHDLFVRERGQLVDVGDMSVELTPTWGAEKFLQSVRVTLSVTLIEAFLIGIVLLLVAQWLVTAPLRRAAAKISHLYPDALESSDFRIDIPALHRSDELGLLLNHTNELLDRLVDSQKELKQLATRDALTGLPNRTLIMESLRQMLANAQRASHQVAVLFVDLDRFKSVNDSLGHAIGDKLLVAVAQTLTGQLREQDSVGRLGGDEFLVIMPIVNVKDVVIVVRRIIDALSHNFEIDGIELRTGASIGIAIYPDDGSEADVMIRRADLAMYKAKTDASTRWQMFSAEMGHALEAGVFLETALAGAVLRNEMQIYLQPQFSALKHELAGCEALLRWQHKGEWIQPDRFIGIAESSGLIREIGDWVIAEACRKLQEWGNARLPISVNLSARQLADEGFVERVLEQVQQAGVAPRLLGFEITETALMQNLDQSHERLTRLREAGFRISIDDFGTGYSSLSYLTRLPVDELKIDRSFVSGTQRSSIVLNTIIALARALDMSVVAEGVETEMQSDELRALGCDLLQGYLHGRPMPVDEFEEKFEINLRQSRSRPETKLRRIQ